MRQLPLHNTPSPAPRGLFHALGRAGILRRDPNSEAYYAMRELRARRIAERQNLSSLRRAKPLCPREAFGAWGLSIHAGGVGAHSRPACVDVDLWPVATKTKLLSNTQ